MTPDEKKPHCQDHSGNCELIADTKERLGVAFHEISRMRGRLPLWATILVAIQTGLIGFFGTKWTSDYEQIQRVTVIQQHVLQRLDNMEKGLRHGN